MKKINIDYSDGRFILGGQSGHKAEVPTWIWWLYLFSVWIERKILYPRLIQVDEDAWQAAAEGKKQ